MAKVILSFCLFVLFGLVACAPTAEPSAELPTPAPTAEPPTEPTSDMPQPTYPAVEPAPTVDFGVITPEPSPMTTPNLMPAPGLPGDPQEIEMTNMAIKDLAEKLSLDTAEITVVERRSVQWADSSLGCPEPGMMYLMVITPGYQITLSAEGKTYNYHTDTRQYVVLCEQKFAPGTGGGTVEE